jgi:dipeptidyl-peptidase-4
MTALPFRSLLFLVFLNVTAAAIAQGTRADYDRSNHLGQITQNKVFYAQVVPHWTADGNAFWYRKEGPDHTRQFIWVDAIAGTKQQAFDHEKLAVALGTAEKTKLSADHLPIDSLEKGEKPGILIIHATGKRWQLDLGSYAIIPLTGEGKTTNDSLPILRRTHPSETGDETTITFVNHTSKPIKLFWIDTGGKPVDYGSVDPGAKFEQNTYAGHVWKITDKDGRQLAVFEAVEGGGDAVVENPPGKQQSPDADLDPPQAKWAAFVRNNNVFLRDPESGDEVALTTDGKPGDSYDGDFIWSPNRKKFVAYKTLDGDHRKVYIVTI